MIKQQAGWRQVWAGMLMLTLIAASAFAHRGHETWTDVVWADGYFEITHQIHIADALNLLESMDADADIESMEGLTLLALHVEANFRISDASEAVALDTIGAEIDDDFLYVFQEWVTPLPKQIPVFQSEILREVESNIISMVHYQAPGVSETLNVGTGVPRSTRQLPSAEWLIAL